MIAGYYLGEVFRLVLLDLHSQGHMFHGKDLKKLMEPYCLDTSVLAEIESDPSENLIETWDMFMQRFGVECTEPELSLIRRLTEVIGERAARLSACGVAAITKKKNIQVRLSPGSISFCFFISQKPLPQFRVFCSSNQNIFWTFVEL